MNNLDQDTICALATPQGTGGIAVIRISGETAFRKADGILRQRRRCELYDGYSLHRALVVDREYVVDDVIVSVFHGPKSFTGEDVVEISCHGSPVATAQIISLLISAGCRAAGPGEFTRRAFLNGKLDLTQAEAVCDMINARTEAAYRQAQSQRMGKLSQAVTEIRSQLLAILAQIEASIDFPEDVGELDFGLTNEGLAIAESALTKLAASADRGILLRQGAQVVLVGRPNVGKSSVMNALLRHERAIVTEVAGTTRDTLEESLNLNGIAVRLWDTAGLRITDDPAETLGVERSHAAIESADLVVLVIDSTVGISPEDHEIIQSLPASRLLTVWNKSDLNDDGDLRISAKLGTGLDELEKSIYERLSGGESTNESDEPTIAHAHQRLAIERSAISVQRAKQTISESLPADFLSVDVRAALIALGELTGQTANDDLINEIFAKFCIGK